jgi:hypothetical protein
VDIDTTDVTSTSLTSTNTDAALSVLTAVPATDLFLNGTPPTHKRVIANHLGRMFAAVDMESSTGTVQVTNGSVNVNVTGGFFLNVFVGRQLRVTGATQTYTIASLTSNLINPGQTQLQLTVPYADASDPYATYSIRPAPTERRLIYFSRALLPESWPASNAISVQEDGDEITGLMPFSSFLYVLERRHVYRFTFQSDPLTDGFIFQALNRGCVNQRCWVAVEGTAYMLDDQGIHAYAGARDSDPISAAIQDVFRFSDSPFRVNWAAQRWFHAVHFAPQEVIRWFVALSGQYLPYHAICYNYRQKRWWIEEWPQNVGGSVAGRLQGSPQVYLGATSGRVLAMWQGTLDGFDFHGVGVPRGQVSNAYPDSFTSPGAAFNAVFANAPVSIVDGRGKGQQRIVAGTVQKDGTYIRVTQPWLIQPDATSVYQFGGVQWRVQLGWWRTLLDEQLNERYIAVVFQTCTQPALATLRLFTDFSSAPTPWRGDWTLNDGDGVRTVKDSPDVVLDLTKATGYVKKRFPGHREFFTDGPRYLSFQLSGVSNQDWQRIFYVMCGGVDQGG